MPKAILLQHPSAEAILKDPRDPYVLPQLGHDAPITATATEPEQVCVCGVATRHHMTMNAKTWLGCQVAKLRQHGPKNPERWNDPHPNVTCAVRKALLVDCGPAMEIHCDGAYTHDELLTVALAIAKAAIREYRLSVEKGQ
jgi:hypothetical protein